MMTDEELLTVLEDLTRAMRVHHGGMTVATKILMQARERQAKPGATPLFDALQRAWCAGYHAALDIVVDQEDPPGPGLIEALRQKHPRTD